MSEAVAESPRPPSIDAIEQALVGGDLKSLTTDQRVSFYNETCRSLGLNPLTKPFEYITLNNKLTLYARKDATDQLRSLRGISIVDMSSEERDGVYIVTARAQDSHGRTDIAKGAVTIKGLQNDGLANAIMKAETKAKRRVTLSICGLGILDETEVETIPHVRPQPAVTNSRPAQTPEQRKNASSENPDRNYLIVELAGLFEQISEAEDVHLDTIQDAACKAAKVSKIEEMDDATLRNIVLGARSRLAKAKAAPARA